MTDGQRSRQAAGRTVSSVAARCQAASAQTFHTGSPRLPLPGHVQPHRRHVAVVCRVCLHDGIRVQSTAMLVPVFCHACLRAHR